MIDKYVTVEDAAEKLKTHPEGVRRWLRQGVIDGFRLVLPGDEGALQNAAWVIPAAALRGVMTRNRPCPKCNATQNTSVHDINCAKLPDYWREEVKGRRGVADLARKWGIPRSWLYHAKNRINESQK